MKVGIKSTKLVNVCLDSILETRKANAILLLLIIISRRKNVCSLSQRYQIFFDTKEMAIELNDVNIEPFPSHGYLEDICIWVI